MKIKKAICRALLLALPLTAVLTSCDSGDIEETTSDVVVKGKTVKLTARISGVKSWTSNTVALAGFSDKSNYSVVQRSIPSNTADSSEVSIVLSNIGEDVNTVELVLTNKLRERIITLASIDMDSYESNSANDTIYMDLGDFDVSLFGCMQNGVFNKACIQCHGGNGKSAGGLNLTAGNSYANLVDVASQKKEGYTRVISGDYENSLMRIILNEGGENMLHYNHTEVLSSQFKSNLSEVKKLIDDWIASLK